MTGASRGFSRAAAPVWGFSRGTMGHMLQMASQVAQVVKNLPANAGDVRDAGLIPGSGRSPGGGVGNHFSVLA